MERRVNQDLVGARAGGLHARTIEILDQRGIAERFLAEGTVAQVAGFAQIRLDISDFPTRHPYGLALWQNDIERILAGWVDELGVRIYRGQQVSSFVRRPGGLNIELSDGTRLAAEYLVGCDGGRSTVRKAAGIEFRGWEATTSYLLAEAQFSCAAGEEPQWGIRHDPLGVHALAKPDNGGAVRIMVTERHLNTTGTPTLAELSEALVAVYGTSYGIHSPAWISRFTDAARQAVTYRDGRILLAGDAAHVHHPVGGQGLNTGVQDAVNLGWKLGQVVNKTSPDALLDTYHAERHPIAARVLRNSLAQIALLRNFDERTDALRDTLSGLLALEEPRIRFGGMMSGLDIRYDLGDAHPLVGRRMPDLDLITATGPTRMYSLLHDARPVLLNLDEARSAIASHATHVRWVNAKHLGRWELPVVGAIPAPNAVLVRPDGYVAWAGDVADPDLLAALKYWFADRR